MEVFFWCCFLTGVMFTLITLLFGELLSGWADSLAGHPIAFLRPVVWVGALTSFGGAGILLVRYAPFGAIFILLTAALLAIALSMLVWFIYVKPMRRSQNSTGFSMNELVGYHIQEARSKQSVVEEQMKVELVRKEREIDLEGKEILRREKQYDAEVKKKADADRYSVEQAAEAEKSRKAIADAERAKGTAESRGHPSAWSRGSGGQAEAC